MHRSNIAVWIQVVIGTLLTIPIAAGEPDAPTAYSIRRDVLYHTAADVPLLADIYQPTDFTDRCPVVAVVHGGAWMSGDKGMPATYARMFAENGIAAVSINYRLAPAHKFPAQVDDVRAAMAWIHDNAEANRWDLQRFGMFGYSAGAHLCSLIGTLTDEPDATVRKTTALPCNDPIWNKLPRPAAIVAGGTPVDFRRLPIDNSMLAYFFGGSRREVPEAYHFGSPAALASVGDPPTLFYHGSNDLLVPIENSESFCRRQVALGIDSEFIRLEGVGHLLAFMDAAARENTLRFMKAKLAE